MNNMETYLNKAAIGVGATVGAVSTASAGNSTDVIIELLPVIIELVIVLVMIGYILKMVQKLG